MLRIHLWKEWRELRLLFLMSAGVLLALPAGLAWALPKSGAIDLPWFAIAMYVGALVLGSELVGGEGRRRHLDYLARLPKALPSALVVKCSILVLGVVAFGVIGYAAEVLIAVITNTESVRLDRYEVTLGMWAVALAGWLLATSCWRPAGLSSFALTLILTGLLTAPLVYFAHGRVGIAPVPLDVEATGVYAIAAGLALCWFGFRAALPRPREGRRLPVYAAAVGLAFVPLYGVGASNIWRWHHVDADSSDITIHSPAFVGSGQKLAFLTLETNLLRGGVHYAVVVDLETGAWRQVGPSLGVWNTLHGVDRGFSFQPTGGPTPLLVRIQVSPDGERLVDSQDLVDGRSGRVLATGARHRFDDLPDGLLLEAAQELSPYRTGDGAQFFVQDERLWVVQKDGTREELPLAEGDYPFAPAGLGFRLANTSGTLTRRYFDLNRRRVFELDVRNSYAVIRDGAWVSVGSGSMLVSGRQEEWRLYWPETGELAPVRGLNIGDKLGPLVDARRFVVYRKYQTGLWLVDPESGTRTPLAAPQLEGKIVKVNSRHLTQWLGTPSGVPIVRIDLGEEQVCFGKIVDEELICTPPLLGRVDIVSCQDEESLVVVVKQRTLERLYFGRDDRQVLFPRN